MLNHSSSQHPWFLEAQKDENSPYRDYYVWSKTFEQGYTQLGDWYYESRFVDTMPDLNLDNPNLREEIVKIMSFWLKDIGVDGFRLDAVTSYYTGELLKNVEFLSWPGTRPGSFPGLLSGGRGLDRPDGYFCLCRGQD